MSLKAINSLKIIEYAIDVVYYDDDDDDKTKITKCSSINDT